MFSKWVTIIISPLGTSLLLGFVALMLALIARRKKMRQISLVSKDVLGGLPAIEAGLLNSCRNEEKIFFTVAWSLWIAVFAWAWLWVWSMPVTSDALLGWIEDQAGPRQIEALPQTRVMVVLGGGISGPRLPRRPNPDLNAYADRLWHAARLFRAGKASQIILTGGVLPTGDGSEAEAMRQFMLDLGIPASAMSLESESENTAANARLTAEMLAKQGVTEILLVTSAFHMPRAKRIFDRYGLTVIPAPTDFEIIDMPFDLLRLMPNANALNGSAKAMKELLGYWVEG